MLRTSSFGHILVVCTAAHYIWLSYSTATFNMTRVVDNNVYRALLEIKREDGHSISGEFSTNNIEGFEAVQENGK